jgi:hypothetical protein
VADELIGTAVFGQETDIAESNSASFSLWTGTGTVTGSGNSEAIVLADGESMESPTWNIGSGTVRIRSNVYASGSGDAVIEYKQGSSSENCDIDSWSLYTEPFSSAGWVKVKIKKISSVETIFIGISSTCSVSAKSGILLIPDSGYEIEMREVGAGSSTTIDVGNALEYEQTGLNPGTQYEARVRAYDSGIYSDWTSWVQEWTDTGAQTLTGVSSICAVPATAGSSFGYEIEMREAGAGTSTTVDVGMNLKYNQTGLDPATEYEARVWAYIGETYPEWTTWAQQTTNAA